MYSIPGYHFISKPRPVGSGGGVGIFLRDTYEYKKRCDLESMNCVPESVFAEIVQPNNEKNVILGCLYKLLNVQTEIFNDEIKQFLLKLALRINYVSFLVTLTSIFLMLTHMSLLMISLISCILMVYWYTWKFGILMVILLSLNNKDHVSFSYFDR